MNKSISDLIYLCKCAVNDVAPDKALVDGMDVDRLYNISKSQTVVAMVAYALEAAGVNDERFKQAKEKAIRKNMLLDVERGKLFAFLDENKIWHMPLKGSILKDIYPKIGMRQMSDNDILFDKEYAEIVKNYFDSLGYECETYGKSHHDAYLKKPIYNFEMHRALFANGHSQELIDYYSNVFDRLIKNDGQEYCYHFCDEDFYLFMIAHEHKHFSAGGTGIRSLIDTYVYLNAKGDVLDYDYIEKQCEILKIGEFEKGSRDLALKIFGLEDGVENIAEASDKKPALVYKNPEEGLNEENLKMLGIYLTSGTYGSIENIVGNALDRQYKETGTRSKFKYLLSRLFPMSPAHKRLHPFIYKSIVLIPFYWIYRFFRGLFVSSKRVKRELKALKNK